MVEAAIDPTELARIKARQAKFGVATTQVVEKAELAAKRAEMAAQAAERAKRFKGLA